MATEAAAARGYVLGPGEGDRIAWSGVEIAVKASAERTGGRFSLLEDRSEEMTVPMHIHEREDEAFYVLDGHFTIRCGEDTFEAGPRSFVFLPRGVPHAHTAGAGGATKLILGAPGGLETFFRGMADGFAGGMTPDKRAAIAAASGLRFLP